MLFTVYSLGLYTINTVCLIIVILASFSCNICSILFINRKNHDRSLKDKIVTILCIINCGQSIGYIIELQATIKNAITVEACKASGFFVCTLTYMSVGYFVALTVERYLAIKEPFNYVTWFSEGRNAWWLIFPPIVAILLGIAPIAGWSGYDKSRMYATYCGFQFDKSQESRSYFLTVCFFVFVIPLTVTTAAYARILVELRQTAIETKRKYGRNSNISRASDNTVKEQSLSCFMTGFVYIASWVPYTIVCFQYYYGSNVSIEFEYISIYLSKSSTISSPLIYCLIERRFRNFVRRRLSIRSKSSNSLVEKS